MFLRLLSDSMSVRCLNDLRKSMRSIVPATGVEVPVLVDVGYKERGCVTPVSVPGIHVRVRPELD